MSTRGLRYASVVRPLEIFKETAAEQALVTKKDRTILLYYKKKRTDLATEREHAIWADYNVVAAARVMTAEMEHAIWDHGPLAKPRPTTTTIPRRHGM